MMPTLENLSTPEQREVLDSLSSPVKIQAFLDEVHYPATERNRCPLNVLQDRQGHCLDGGLFAAAALRRLGHPPLIVDLLPEPGLDDDHVLAIFKQHGCYGAVAKSNFTGLRYREPVFRSLRELVMSYFEFFFNVDGLKTLRAYTRPYNLATFDHLNWVGSDTGADAIEKRLKELHPIPLLTPEQIQALSPTDPLTYQAGMLVVNKEGLYKPQV
jgi:hypothetical protein